MAKIRRKKKRSDLSNQLPQPPWADEDGVHMLVPGSSPTPEAIEEATKAYQRRIRNSPIWDTMVSEFGEEKAQEMLQDFQVNIQEPKAE